MMEGWVKMNLGSLSSTQKGYAFKSNWYQDKGVAIARVSDFTENSISEDNLLYVSHEIAKDYSKYKLKRRDIIIQTVGSGPNNPASIVGKVICVPENLNEALLNQNAVKLLPNDLIDNRFLYYRLKDEHFKYYCLNHSKGGANQMSITLDSIRRFEFLLPPLPTQRKIATILSAYDDLIENNLKRIKLLEEKAQLTYEEWFVRMKFPGHETTPINKETGLPEEWELVKVGALLAKLKSTKKIKSSEILESGSTPVIDQSRDFIKGYTNEPDALIDIDEPIIVFGDHTRILKFIDFNFARGADGTQLVLSKDPRMPQHLFYQVLKGIDLSDYHYARHFKYLKDTEINICDEITAKHYEDFSAPLFKAIKQMRDQNKLLREARDILLSRLMTGIIDVEQMDIETFQPITA